MWWSSGYESLPLDRHPGFESRPGASPQCGLRGGKSHYDRPWWAVNLKQKRNYVFTRRKMSAVCLVIPSLLSQAGVLTGYIVFHLPPPPPTSGIRFGPAKNYLITIVGGRGWGPTASTSYKPDSVINTCCHYSDSPGDLLFLLTMPTSDCYNNN